VLFGISGINIREQLSESTRINVGFGIEIPSSTTDLFSTRKGFEIPPS
jgi:hypothetical protein